MNKLSWLLYTADVSESLSQLFWLIFTLGCIVQLIVFCVVISHNYTAGDDDQQSWTNKRLYIPLIISAAVIIPGVLLPSKTTMYAIAASEVGEQMLKTPTAAKALNAVNAWLDKQTIEMKKPEEK